jgi:hypothetical protein
MEPSAREGFSCDPHGSPDTLKARRQQVVGLLERELSLHEITRTLDCQREQCAPVAQSLAGRRSGCVERRAGGWLDLPVDGGPESIPRAAPGARGHGQRPPDGAVDHAMDCRSVSLAGSMFLILEMDAPPWTRQDFRRSHAQRSVASRPIDRAAL